MSSRDELRFFLEDLGVVPGDLVYLHTSFRRFAYTDLGPQELIDGLLEYLGPQGTLVMPSFAWHLDKSNRPWVGYQQYFETRPVFDVRKTAANIGAVPELFRNLPQARRSLSYWWSVAAVGPLSDAVVANQDKVDHPYGPGSTFDQLRALDVVILGLGVTLNTTSLAFVPDYYLGNKEIMTDHPQAGIVIDEQGEARTTHSYWLLPEAVRHVKPEVVFQRSERLRANLRRVDRNKTVQFAYHYSVYHEEALKYGKEAMEKGCPPPWLDGLYQLRSGESV